MYSKYRKRLNYIFYKKIVYTYKILIKFNKRNYVECSRIPYFRYVILNTYKTLT